LHIVPRMLISGTSRTWLYLLQAKNIVIATGGQATRIPIPGAEHAIISDKVGWQLLQLCMRHITQVL